MKRGALIIGFPLVLLLFFIGCAGAPEPAPEEPAPVVEEEPAVVEEQPAEEEPVKEPRLVMQKFYLPVKESFYFSDGYLDTYKEYVYSKEDSLLQELTYDSEGSVTETVVYEYSGDIQIRRVVYDAQQKMTSYREFAYNDAGLIVSDTFFNNKDEVQTIQQYEWDEAGNKIKWSIFDGAEALLSYSEYIYDGDRLSRINNYDPAGEIQEYFEMEYDGDGNLVKDSHFNSDGSLEAYSEYLYESGFRTGEIQHRGNKSVKRRIVFTNDEAGNPQKIEFMNAGGTLQDYSEREYIEREREVLIYE